MAEYIEKQAAIDAINHELLCGSTADACGLETAYDLIHELNPTDVRPVVLCKDCTHWDRDTIEMHDRCNNAEEGVDKTQARFAECLKFSSWAKCMMMREDDYCSLGRFAIKGIKDDANPRCGSYNEADMRGGDSYGDTED